MLEVSERRKNADIEFDQMIRDRRDYMDWWRKLSDMFAPNRGRFSVDELPRSAQSGSTPEQCKSLTSSRQA